MRQALIRRSKLIEGVSQWPFRAVATALEVIPRTLIENCGASPIRLLTALRAKHSDFALAHSHSQAAHAVQSTAAAADGTTSNSAPAAHLTAVGAATADHGAAATGTGTGTGTGAPLASSPAVSASASAPASSVPFGLAGSGVCSWGIDGNAGVLADMMTVGVFEPFAVKSQTIKTAIEAACLLLRIDDIVSGMSGKGGAGGPGPGAGVGAGAGAGEGQDEETFGDQRDG